MSTQKPTILYVDDEEVNLFIFEHMFKQDFNIKTAQTAEAGLEMLGQPEHGINLVITDKKIHPTSGVGFIKRAADKGIKIPFCMLSAYAITPEVQELVDKGHLSRYFNKPLDFELIKSEVKSILNC